MAWSFKYQINEKFSLEYSRSISKVQVTIPLFNKSTSFMEPKDHIKGSVQKF